MSLATILTPSGRLLLERDETAQPFLAPTVVERIEAAFEVSKAAGLEALYRRV